MSLLLSSLIRQLYGLMFLGSTTAFSAMVNTTIMFLQTACVIPQAILLFRGRERVLPNRYFSLGKFGPWVNGIAVAWVMFLDILYCFPTVLPVTAANMSYVIVVAVGLLMFVVVFWFASKRTVFVGPNVNVELMMERRQAALEVQRESHPKMEQTETNAN